MSIRSWLVGSVVALVAGLVVAVPITVADWRLNPSGIFRDEQGTHWTVVAETALSWFLPVAISTLLISVAVHVLIRRLRAG